MKLARLLGLGGVMVLLTWQAAIAQPVWPKLILTEMPGTYNFLTHITHAGDGSGRLFIVERSGVIKIFRDSEVLSTPFLDIRDRVGMDGEGGLLSVAFPQDFATSGVFYVYYSSNENLVPPDGALLNESEGNSDTVVSRFHVTNDMNIADPDSEEQILLVNHPTLLHYGGQLAFGPDGYLYISIGDGGGAGDPLKAAQNTKTLLGKLLRVEVGATGSYTVPMSNPFYGHEEHRPEIWALGLRNPWRFSFDRLTGDLYIADVGQELYEEINFQPWDRTTGENYGWSIMEGNHCYGAETCDSSGFTLPIVEYEHTVGGCAVIGGFVYRGTRYPNLAGTYLYGDVCTGLISGLRRDNQEWVSRALLSGTSRSIWLTTFGEDEEGNIYVPFRRRDSGEILEFGLYQLGALPTATLTITKTLVGQTPDAPWQFNGNDDIGAFTLPATGGSITFTVAAGTYTVTEAFRNGYGTEVACTNGVSASDASVAITVTGGIDLGCTFTNTAQAYVTITKTVVGPRPATDWRFTGSGEIGDFTLPAIGGSATFTVPTGVYTVTEETQDDYTPKIACTNGASASSATTTFTLPIGAHLGCTFTNTYDLGAVTGRIYVSSDGNDQPDTGDGIVDAMVALYSTAAITPSETTLAVRTASFLTTTDPVTTTSQVDGSYILTNVPAGMYTVTVTLPAGFEPIDSQLIEVLGGMTTTVDFIATPLPVNKEFYLPLLPN